MKNFPIYRQLDAMDCGPTCLRMIARYYGKSYSLQTLRERSNLTRTGVNLLGISEAAESIGFRTTGVKLTFQQLRENVNLPCILHWKQNHFVVCHRISGSRKPGRARMQLADPACGLLTMDETTFMQSWVSSVHEGQGVGVALLLQPGPDFKKLPDESNQGERSLRNYLSYLSPYRNQVAQVLFGMLLLSVIQLIFPFLTQALVDVGVKNNDLKFIELLLLAQLVLFAAKLSVEYVRSWIVLHINTRVNIALVSDFFIKLMRLPLRFFDTKMVGDILQRIDDQRRIETFLTGNSMNIVFSSIGFLVFGGVLAYYNLSILLVFLLGNALYVCWILWFMKYRRAIDNERFQQSSKEQSHVIQMINGMPDIKLNNCERQKRWTWERIQVQLFRLNVRNLALGQTQQVGSVFFSQTTNILITFLAAQSVVQGSMTLGMMLAVTYIIGQLSAPVEQFIGVAQSFQEARLSLERLNEIHRMDDEETRAAGQSDCMPQGRDLSLNKVSFSYEAADRDFVLEDIDLVLPERQITAIVGASGSGKTTLIKLLMGFYEPTRGEVKLGESRLSEVRPSVWRERLGSVLQEGFLFSDTIANNIALGEDDPDMERLRQAVKVANIDTFIEALPLKFNTMIGQEGKGLSQGQKQRILIARAVYKNPEYLFFDEATNALDATNEQVILNNLRSFFNGKTVVIVAHRLSTVRDADRIVVLNQGRIAETGTHEELTAKRGLYYELVRNQLELGT